MRHYVIYETTATGYSAYPPTLVGVAVTGSTREETRERMRRAITLHIEGLREDGRPVPETSGEFVEPSGEFIEVP
jgi:predicted RNase H-like HicB family nuclease